MLHVALSTYYGGHNNKNAAMMSRRTRHAFFFVALLGSANQAVIPLIDGHPVGINYINLLM